MSINKYIFYLYHHSNINNFFFRIFLIICSQLLFGHLIVLIGTGSYFVYSLIFPTIVCFLLSIVDLDTQILCWSSVVSLLPPVTIIKAQGLTSSNFYLINKKYILSHLLKFIFYIL